MNSALKESILKATNASELTEVEKIQDLWSGYGTIKRFSLLGSDIKSIVVKHVNVSETENHPRGWNSNLSHQRKLKSYQVETAWYQNWSKLCGERCYVPRYYAVDAPISEGNFLIVLEDLQSSGFPLRKTAVSISEMKVCLKWLARFHATFLGESPKGLWETGTYWHLETRPDELAVLKDKNLRQAASLLDKKLKNSPFQTFVHGDAKLANFCFSKDGKKVAAVDFQYVGGGCGMKDVAYFIGSCLEEKECERHQDELLDYYFDVLTNIVTAKKKEIDPSFLAENWRALFPVAWADFHRFIKGWSPGHWKINSYSERITREALKFISKTPQ